MRNDYGGVIWTSHALDRLKQRDISQGDAWATFRRPDRSRSGKKRGAYVYYKTWNFTDSNGRKRNEMIEVVATKNDKGEWIILSVWSKTIKIDKNKVPFKTPKSFFQRLVQVLGF